MIRTSTLLFLILTSAAMATETPPVVDLSLGRAVDLWVSGDLHGAAAHLEAIDISRESSATDSHRAAFLLAVAYLRLADRDGLARVVDTAGDPEGSQYRRWVAYIGLLESGGDPLPIDGFAGSEILAAARQLNLTPPA